MDTVFPIFSCIFVGIVLTVCCCIRRQQTILQDQYRYQEIEQDQEAVYIAAEPPQPTAPPMPTIYEEDDPNV